MTMIEMLATFEVGHPEIDSDHRRIVEIMNDILEAIKADEYPRCRQLFDAFITLSADHFAREEGILEKVGFPRVEQHRIYHRDLLARAEAVKSACDGETEQTNLLACFEELADFLVHDIVQGDLDFKSYLDQAQRR